MSRHNGVRDFGHLATPEKDKRMSFFRGRSMKTASITLVTLLGLGLVIPAGARDHDEHRDEHRRAEHHEHEREREHWRYEHERERHWDREHGRHHDPFARKDPPGWEHGKKKGWGDCDLPPGQARKQGCEAHHEYPHAGAPPRVVERPVIVHRPVVVNQPVATQPPMQRPQAPTKKPVFVPHTPEQIREAQRQERR
jgi:hypothetical protein